MRDDVNIRKDMAGKNMDIVILHVEGIVDTDTSRHLSKALEEVIANHHYKVIMDLEKVDYISSAGWGIFIGELRELRRNEGDLKLTSMTSEVEDVYRLLEFYNVLKSFPNIDAAIKDFK